LQQDVGNLNGTKNALIDCLRQVCGLNAGVVEPMLVHAPKIKDQQSPDKKNQDRCSEQQALGERVVAVALEQRL
jgi:hypothetical protein